MTGKLYKFLNNYRSAPQIRPPPPPFLAQSPAEVFLSRAPAICNSLKLQSVEEYKLIRVEWYFH